MSIKAYVATYLKSFTADVEFSDTAVSFHGPAWEIGFFFGLLPIKGKRKELLRIEYDNIAQVTVRNAKGLTQDACVVKLQNGTQIDLSFTPFEPGRNMLYEKVPDRFV